jgi:hypothetical protein
VAGLLSLVARSGHPGLTTRPLRALVSQGRRSTVQQLLELVPWGRRFMAAQQVGGAVGPPPSFLCGSDRGWTIAVVGRWLVEPLPGCGWRCVAVLVTQGGWIRMMVVVGGC